ncbi:MAG: ATP-binding cassette domain-containing protein [Deltaproteobacteria bacterium]|nr:ATP-binding cassette domain-containing protein [Deltaproteobacteria bacterium]
MEQPSLSISPLQNNCSRLRVEELRFLSNGPYTFTLEEGECVGLSGKSGIGKTQLLRAVTDIIPHSGQLFLDGTPAATFSAPLWRCRVTMVPAESFWWYDTVGDHFAAGFESQSIKKTISAVGFEEDVFKWRISRLSTGEKQRLALVRSLCNTPSVLLLDEPCSSLDAYHTTLIENFIQHYVQQKNASVLWVSHDSQQLKRVAVRELCLEKGGLVERREKHF